MARLLIFIILCMSLNTYANDSCENSGEINFSGQKVKLSNCEAHSKVEVISVEAIGKSCTAVKQQIKCSLCNKDKCRPLKRPITWVGAYNSEIKNKSTFCRIFSEVKFDGFKNKEELDFCSQAILFPGTKLLELETNQLRKIDLKQIRKNSSRITEPASDNISIDNP